MADDGEVRERFKTVRFSTHEFAVIEDAARRAGHHNPSKVIREAAVAEAERIVETTDPPAHPEPERRPEEPSATDRWLEERRRHAEEIRREFRKLEEESPELVQGGS